MIGRTRWHFAAVDSTQRVAFRLADMGAAHGTVVRADFQSAGRGRQGRSWESPAGSALMFSVILRPIVPMHQLGTLSILIAGALADVFSDLVNGPVHIKWPNDVLIGGRKVSGILLQTRGPVAVAGIGINIDSPAESLPLTATRLSRHATERVSPDQLLEMILPRLNTMWSEWKTDLSTRQIERLEHRLWQIGEDVSLLDADREIRGRILGLDPSGGLRLGGPGGERVIMAGEIVRGPRPIPGS